MRTMMNFISVCLILVCTTQICAQQRCSILRISGTSLAHHVSGRYQILSSNEVCSGRQAYKQEGGNNYLYYHSGSAGDVWLVSDEFCIDEAFLQVFDNATNPENIIDTWGEVNEKSNWTRNALIKIVCDTGGFEGCNELRVSNARYNFGVQGRYRVLLQTSLCYGRYTYKHVSKTLYLYSHNNWYIDSENCDDSLTAEVYAQFLDGAYYPEDIRTAGQEPRAFNWVTTGLTVRCSAPSLQGTTTKRYTWRSTTKAPSNQSTTTRVTSGVETQRGMLGLTLAVVILSLGLQ